MKKGASINIRMEPELKKEAESILTSLGLSASTVITLLYKQIVVQKRLPFEVTLTQHPICLDEMSDEELNKRISKSIKSIVKGNYCTIDELEKILDKNDNL